MSKRLVHDPGSGGTSGRSRPLRWPPDRCLRTLRTGCLDAGPACAGVRCRSSSLVSATCRRSSRHALGGSVRPAHHARRCGPLRCIGAPRLGRARGRIDPMLRLGTGDGPTRSSWIWSVCCCDSRPLRDSLPSGSISGLRACSRASRVCASCRRAGVCAAKSGCVLGPSTSSWRTRSPSSSTAERFTSPPLRGTGARIWRSQSKDATASGSLFPSFGIPGRTSSVRSPPPWPLGDTGTAESQEFREPSDQEVASTGMKRPGSEFPASREAVAAGCLVGKVPPRSVTFSIRCPTRRHRMRRSPPDDGRQPHAAAGRR